MKYDNEIADDICEYMQLAFNAENSFFTDSGELQSDVSFGKDKVAFVTTVDLSEKTAEIEIFCVTPDEEMLDVLQEDVPVADARSNEEDLKLAFAIGTATVFNELVQSAEKLEAVKELKNWLHNINEQSFVSALIKWIKQLRKDNQE